MALVLVHFSECICATERGQRERKRRKRQKEEGKVKGRREEREGRKESLAFRIPKKKNNHSVNSKLASETVQ